MHAHSLETVRLEGPIFVHDTLFSLFRGELDATDGFRPDLPPGIRLNDEISRSFVIATSAWRELRERGSNPSRKDLRLFLWTLFVRAFGHSETPIQPPDDLSFRLPISVPVFFVPSPTLSLDTRDRRYVSPEIPARSQTLSQFVQQWLNLRPDALWAVATDGRTLRILRDNNSLSRPAYLEFDLACILEEGRQSDFSCLFRLLYRGCLGSAPDASASLWEKLRAKGLEDGVRVFSSLRDGVVKALLHLGDGFLADPSIRTKFNDGRLTSDAFFQQLLRTAYRFLFLFSAEERGILHVPSSSGATDPARIYAAGYSMRRLADRSRRAASRTAHTDLWDSVRIVFRALASGEPRLALPALGGLFRTDQAPDLDAAALSNRALLDAVRALRWTHAAGAEQRVDYRNLGSEELGSVYESLLELVPSVSIENWRFSFVGIPDPREAAAAPARRGRGAARGNSRKLTGSYYTPAALVDRLVLSTLSDAFFEARLSTCRTSAEREASLLSLAILDPACGSGHFLLAAARRIAERLAQVRSGDEIVTPDAYCKALRDVVSHCIYGTDLNPLALELAKTALWIETLVPGQPLSFLDAHFACGNSIIGISNLDQLSQGIPSDFYGKSSAVLVGDDKQVATALRTCNKTALDDIARNPGSSSLFARPDNDLVEARRQIEAMPDATLPEIDAKAAAWNAYRRNLSSHRLFLAADYFVAAVFIPKTDPSAEYPVTSRLVGLLSSDPISAPSQEGMEAATAAARSAAALHWPLVFPEVFARGGFDCILMNPPWDRIKLQEKEFFANRFPAIAEAKNAAARRRLIAQLRDGSTAERALYAAYESALSSSVRQSAFVHAKRWKARGEEEKDVPSARYPLTGIGDVNLYALFAELLLQILRPEGRAGFIVPTGICTDDSTKDYFNALADAGRIESIYDFENRLALFPAVDSRFRFSLVTIGKKDRADLAFLLTSSEQLAAPSRHISLSPEEFRLLNPNTRTCAPCRTGKDVELLKTIHSHTGVLLIKATAQNPEQNPWGIEYKTLFHMSNDSKLFLDAPEADVLPLYEAKMINHFDHRWATFDPSVPDSSSDDDDDFGDEDDGAGKGFQNVPSGDKNDPSFEPRPRYWVRRPLVFARLADIPKDLAQAAKKDNLPAMLAAFANWVVHALPDTGQAREDFLADVLGPVFLSRLPANWYKRKFDIQTRVPLSRDELAGVDDPGFFARLFEARSPKWLLGFRDITNATNSRTAITTVFPATAVGHTLPLFSTTQDPQLAACFLGNLNSLVLDWCARCKVQGVHLTYGYLNQVATLPPTAYTPEDIDYIVPRVLELTYTSYSLRPWAEALGYDGDPFPWDEDRRALLRAELDARYAHLYGLTRDDLRYILDPKSVMGRDFPSESFRVLQDNEVRHRFGEYRTQRMVLDAWDAQEKPTVVADDYKRAQTWDDSRPSYLRFLVGQMIAQSSTHQIPLRELFSAFSALRTPNEISRLDGMPRGAGKWAREYKDAIRDNESLENVLMDMFERDLISISKSGIVSYIDADSLHAADGLTDVVTDARMALAFMKLDFRQARFEHLRRTIDPDFFRQVTEGAYARAA